MPTTTQMQDALRCALDDDFGPLRVIDRLDKDQDVRSCVPVVAAILRFGGGDADCYAPLLPILVLRLELAGANMADVQAVVQAGRHAGGAPLSVSLPATKAAHRLAAWADEETAK